MSPTVTSKIWEPERWRSNSSYEVQGKKIQVSHVKAFSNREEITMPVISAISDQTIKGDLLWGAKYMDSPFPWRSQSHIQAHNLASEVRGLDFRPDLFPLIQISLHNQYVQPYI